MSNKKGRNSLSQTPKSAKKGGNDVATPLGNKRPHEEEEDDSSIDEELSASVANSKKVKKLKQMIAEDGDHSDKDDEEESSDGGDDDDDEEDESEGDSEDEDDEDEDESDDDEDKEEDSEENASDAEQKLPEKVVKSPKQPKIAPKQPEKQTNASPAKSPVAPAPFKASAANVVLFNLPRLKEDELRGFLTKRGVQPESVCCITAPAALVGLPNEAAAKKAISACSGAAYGLKNLAAVSVSGDVSKIQTNKNPNPSAPDSPLTCVLVTFIPKSVTEQDILKMISIKPKNVHLITRGAKNKVSNACYIDCNNEGDARKVYETLQGKEIEKSRLKVFLKPQQAFNPINDKSFIVTNVPFTAGVDEMKKEFPTASHIDVTHKGCFLLQFASADARNKAAEGAKGKTMGGRVLRIVTSDRTGAEFSIFIGNLPFQVKTEEVRGVFPKSNRIHLQVGKNGKCNGTAFVFFPTQEDADAAKKAVSTKQIHGRTLRIQSEETKTAAPEAPKPSKKEAEKPKQKKAELPAQVGSESEEEDENDAQEASDDEGEEGSGDDEGSGEEKGSDDDDDDEEAGDSDDNDNQDGSGEDDGGSDSDEEEPPAKKSKPQQQQQSSNTGSGGDKSRGGFKPFNNGGGKFQRGGRGGGGFTPRGGRGGGGFHRGGGGGGFTRGGRGGGGFRDGNFRGGRGRGGGGTPNRGGRGFKRD